MVLTVDSIHLLLSIVNNNRTGPPFMVFDNEAMRVIAMAILGSVLCRAGWIRVESPGVELLTDAGERSGRQLMLRFEQVRSIFKQAGISPGPLRLRVFAFASPQELRRYRDGSDGFYTPGPDRDYIALYDGPDAGRVAFHEYVHLVLRHSSVPLPKWFDEGTAEFYSTLRIEKGGIRVGEPIASHLALLGREPWLSADALRGRGQGAMFYAESWVLVHMLNLAPEWREGMPQFVSLVSQDQPVETSFRRAFGKSMEDALAALPAYLKTIRAASLAAAVDPPDPPRLERIANIEADLACAGFALILERAELAKKIAANIAESAEAEQMRGAIALAEDRRTEARLHFDRAIQLGSRDPALYFEYATLEREAGRPDMHWLVRTIELDPAFADAHFLIGVRETDAGNFKSALVHLRAATNLRPERSTYWHALGYAQGKAADRAGCVISARRAMATAETDSEEQMARALLDLGGETPAPPLRGPAVSTPDSWKNRRGDARVEGTLIEFDCQGALARIRIRDAAGAIVTLELRHPDRIELVNSPESSLQMPCGLLNRRVAVEYERATSDVTRIEFRL